MDPQIKKQLEILEKLLPGGIAFQLTETMLNKSTIDASKPVREFLVNNSIFDFDELPKGEKEYIDAQLFYRGSLLQRNVSLIRPNAKPEGPGDPRIWVYSLNKNARSNDWIYFAFKEDIFYVIPIETSNEFIEQVKNVFGEQVTYTVSAGLKNLIGKQLITDDFVAVFELVKNSFDAHANKVDIIFEDITLGQAKIIIKDDGKGMSFEELKNKWLFVGYSAKKDGSEDDDYRHDLGVKRVFAGAKGVGRFSCDKLGSKLKLITRKDEQNSKTEILYTDWKKFEENPKARFEDIGLVHESLPVNENLFEHGTQLEISNLDSAWNRQKMLDLKFSLEKLILPQSRNKQTLTDSQRKNFEINIVAKSEIEEDSDYDEDKIEEYYKKVNGVIKNLIFETLELKTTSIEVSISEDGKEISTILMDRGQDIYKIIEGNPFSLHDIYFKIYHLNQSAKVTFARRMGFPIYKYGHVAVYKNGFRIYPFGDVEEDNFGVDIRKSHKEYSRIGTRSLVGRIEINGDNPEFVESTSRDAGFNKNDAYEELKKSYHFVLERFEKYVVDVIKWGKNIGPEDIEQGSSKEKMLDLISEITGSNSIIKLWYNESLVDILASKQEDSAKTLLLNLQKAVEQTGAKEYLDDIRLAQQRLFELEKITEQAEEIARDAKISVEEAKKALEFEQQKNKYLLSIDRNISDDARSLIHNVKIITQKIYSNIEILSNKVKNDSLGKEELLERLSTIRINADKAYRMSRLITKADFRGSQEKRTIEIASYIEEYVNEYLSLFEDRPIKLEIYKKGASLFRKVSLLDLSIVIDNLISNSEKKKATLIRIDFKNASSNQLEMMFSDNGIGLSNQFLNTPDIIFELGITDTDGSGIGLHTVGSVLKDNDATIEFIGNGKVLKGASFKILFN
jgi:signal transduction histidine kinase